MKTDLYLKVVLTVIAVCLVWFCVGKVESLPEAKAQSGSLIGEYQLFEGQYRFRDLDKITSTDIKGVFLLNTTTGRSYLYGCGIKDNKGFERWEDTGNRCILPRDGYGFIREEVGK